MLSRALLGQTETDSRLVVGAYTNLGIPFWTDIQEEWHDEFSSGFGSSVDFSFQILSKTHILIRFSYQSFKPDLQGIRKEIEPKLSGPGSVTSAQGLCGLGILSICAVRMLPWRGFHLLMGAGYYHSLRDKVTIHIKNYDYEFKQKEKWHFPDGIGLNFGIGMDVVRGNHFCLTSESTVHSTLNDAKKTVWIQFLTGLRYHFN